jgi:hypothetical protein
VERFDVIIIGMGPGGEAAAGRLLDAGRRVAVIERELIGGECAYWACIPSKTLLRGPEARAEAGRAAGVSTPSLDWPGVRDYRDYMVRHLDDTAQVRGYEQAGATVIKDAARLAGPGRVEAGGEVLEASHILVATGSQPARPPIEGLDTVTVWTNREATTVRDIPARVVLIGGSAVGTELGQFYARMGAQTTIVQRGNQLIDPVARWRSASGSAVQAGEPCRGLAGRGEPESLQVGNLWPGKEHGNLGVPRGVRLRCPAHRVARRPPPPGRGGGGVRPVAPATKPQPQRSGHNAAPYDPARIVQGNKGVGARIHQRLGVVGRTVEHPSPARGLDGGSDQCSEAGSLVIA